MTGKSAAQQLYTAGAIALPARELAINRHAYCYCAASHKLQYADYSTTDGLLGKTKYSLHFWLIMAQLSHYCK